MRGLHFKSEKEYAVWLVKTKRPPNTTSTTVVPAAAVIVPTTDTVPPSLTFPAGGEFEYRRPRPPLLTPWFRNVLLVGVVIASVLVAASTLLLCICGYLVLKG